MAEFKFPDVGEGLTEGVLVAWLVKEGDVLTVDQPIAQVETDKAVVDIPIPFSGKVSKLNFAEGDVLTVGQVMIELDGKVSEKKEKTIPKAVSKEVTEPKATVASINSTGKVLALPKVRRAAKEKRIDLSSVTPTGKHGEITIDNLNGGNAQTVPDVISEVLAKPLRSQSIPKTVEAVSITKDVLASPKNRRLARELGVQLAGLQGNGDLGKITENDIRAAAGHTPLVKETLANLPVNDTDEIVPISRIRQLIGKRMIESKRTTAQVTYCEDIDMTEVYHIRQEVKAKLSEHGIKLSYLPFFIKALVGALKEYPDFNAVLNPNKNELLRKHTYDIGIAVDTPRGLLVPVIKDSDTKGVVALAKEVSEVATRAREGKAKPDELRGSTCTISSIGSLGGTVFTPIINYPEVAILGIGKIDERAVVREGAIVVRRMVTVSLSFDHRVVDGADAARFVNTLKELLEDPALMLVEE
jgi:pyruvate dehydrogenase E2 component (dihydrolipoamide acetyltransferase)